MAYRLPIRSVVMEMHPEPGIFNDPLVHLASNMETITQNTSAATYEPPLGPRPPYWDLTTRIVFASLIALVMILAIIGNILVILVVAKNRGMRTRTNLFLCNLALADLACAIFDMPFTIITMAAGGWIFNNAICQINGFLTPLFLIASIHTLMYMSIHKYLSIKKPFSQGLRRRWIHTMIGCAWFWAVLVGYTSVHGLTMVTYKPYTAQCGPIYPHDSNTYFHFALTMTTCFVLPWIVMLFCYTNVFSEMRAHSRRMAKNTTLEKDAILLQQRRITCTLFLVLIIFIVSWLPYSVYAVYIAAVDDKGQTPIRFNPFSYLCGYINSAVNPILYALRSPAFRQGYKQIIFMWSRHSHRSKDYYFDSMSRGFTRFRSYLQINLSPRMQDMESLNGSLSMTRKHYINNLANAILFPRSRTLSTSSLPQQLLVKQGQRDRGQLTLTMSMRKWFESLKRKETNIPEVDIEAGNIYSAGQCDANRDFIIPEVVVSSEDEYNGNGFNEYEHSDVEDDVFWENDVTIEHAPMFYVAQVSVTPDYDVATEGVMHELTSPTNCDPYLYATETPQSDIRLHVEDVNKHDESEHVRTNDVLESITTPVKKDTLEINTTKGFIHSMIRKASSRKLALKRQKCAKNKANYQDIVLNGRSRTMMHMDRYFSEHNDRLGSTIPKSNSEPLLDAKVISAASKEKRKNGKKFGLGYFIRSISKDKPGSKHGDSRKSSEEGTSDRLKRTKSEKAKKVRRCPSVETLDSLPVESIPRAITEFPEAFKNKRQNKKIRRDERKGSGHERKAKSSLDTSWFIRENKHGKLQGVRGKHRPSSKVKHGLNKPKVAVHRSASDPCLTLKMMEEKVLVRAQTKKRYKRCPTRRVKHAEEALNTDSVPSCRVEFTIGDGEEDDNSVNHLTSIRSRDHEPRSIDSASCESRNSCYDNLPHLQIDHMSTSRDFSSLASSASMNVLDLVRTDTQVTSFPSLVTSRAVAMEKQTIVLLPNITVVGCDNAAEELPSNFRIKQIHTPISGTRPHGSRDRLQCLSAPSQSAVDPADQSRRTKSDSMVSMKGI